MTVRVYKRRLRALEFSDLEVDTLEEIRKGEASLGHGAVKIMDSVKKDGTT
jgi:hypothetical protein